MYSRGGSGAKEVLADLGRGAVAVALDEPLVVVAVAEVLERLIQFVEVGEGADSEELFLERAPEALDAAVAFGGADEGGASTAPAGRAPPFLDFMHTSQGIVPKWMSKGMPGRWTSSILPDTHLFIWPGPKPETSTPSIGGIANSDVLIDVLPKFVRWPGRPDIPGS